MSFQISTICLRWLQFCLSTYYFKDPRTSGMDDTVEEIHLQRGDSWNSDENLIRVPKYYSELEANADKRILHRYFPVIAKTSFWSRSNRAFCFMKRCLFEQRISILVWFIVWLWGSAAKTPYTVANSDPLKFLKRAWVIMQPVLIFLGTVSLPHPSKPSMHGTRIMSVSTRALSLLIWAPPPEMGNETNETKTIYSSQTFKNSSQLGKTNGSGYGHGLCEPASMCLGCWSRRECHHHACLPRWINILLFDRLEVRLIFNDDSMRNVIFERFLKINQIALKEPTKQ